MSLDPDDDQVLARLRMLYRPRPFNLVDLADAQWLQEEAAEHDAALVIVDLLRRAAPINENSAEDFARLRDALEPMLAEGRTVAPLHHFAKLSENQKERQPGERMSGTGAMFGALDVGLYVTKSESGARRLRIEVEARDFATPDPLGVVITGSGSGEHRGLTYDDTARIELDASAAEERDLAAELGSLFIDGAWRTETELASKSTGIGANRDVVKAALQGSPERFVEVSGPVVGRHETAKPWGTIAMHKSLLESRSNLEQTEQAAPRDTSAEQVAPLRGEQPEQPAQTPTVAREQAEQAERPRPGEPLYPKYLRAAVQTGHITARERQQLLFAHRAALEDVFAAVAEREEQQ